tara:strand:- start:4507 stop:5289 length:783 start_codon:yes stop_codon:yes gene_type:complete
MEPSHRNPNLEGRLQNALNDGKAVWAIGDIHGCRGTFEKLLGTLQLSEGDEVICIGDLIDRGPDSEGVLRIVRDSKNIHSLKGNHEEIMSRALRSPTGRTMDFWLRIGGRETLQSMHVDSSKQLEKAAVWPNLTDNFPTEVVLDRFRLVHAGYSLESPLESQSDKERISSRTVFLAQSSLDPNRQIIAGHTPVQKLIDFGVRPPEAGVWFSDTRLTDGRPSTVLIDTGVMLDPKSYRNPRLSAYNLQSAEVREIQRATSQ